MARIWYVYGIIAAVPAPASLPTGLDDAPVVMCGEGDVAALVSELEGADYEPAVIEARAGDVDWVAARAIAHDRVLTWASDRGAVIPLPMYSSIYKSSDAILAMLRERASALRPVLERLGRGREYALRVYRVDAEVRKSLAALSPDIASLTAAAEAASPGQRYLLERKIDERAKEEIRAVGQMVAREIVTALSSLALETAQSPIPRVTADAPGTMVLNAAFLVPPAGLLGFREQLTEIVAERQPAGFHFDFTGPWPPYHFVPSDVA